MTTTRTITLYCADDFVLTARLTLNDAATFVYPGRLEYGNDVEALRQAHRLLGLNHWRAEDPVIVSWVRGGLGWPTSAGIRFPLVLAFASLISGRPIAARFRDGDGLIPRGSVDDNLRFVPVARIALSDYLDDVETP